MMLMEIEEIEAVLHRVWDLHDKLSDAIHSISRAHFLTSVQARKPQARTQPPSPEDFYFPTNKTKDSDLSDGNTKQNGYVFVKEFQPVQSAVQEAKSLNSIRTALEDLEDQLEFFHTVQTQQRAERDVAIARLEQSRLVLAMRLAEHHGKKHNVIKEAEAFVGDVGEVSRFMSPENVCSPAPGKSTDNVVVNWRKRFNVLNLLWSKINFFKKTLKLEQMGGVIGNAALVALSMLLLMHVQQAGPKGKNTMDQLHLPEDVFKRNKTVPPPESSSPSGSPMQLDVLLARG